MATMKRAILSVFDKTGLVPFAKILQQAGIELLSTGGTARALREADIPVIELSEFTGWPEMLDGRVKTLHPKVHGGLLYLRGNPEHEAAAQRHGIVPIDMVVVNLYPFEATVARPGTTLAEAIENIDIGGPSMIRSASKNHEYVTVVTDPADYAVVADEILATGTTSLALRRRLAAKAFARTSAYDAAISKYLSGVCAAGETQTADESHPWPPKLVVEADLAQPLRYGENPHQSAALYGRFKDYYRQLKGKELSYNNILDLTAAAALLEEFADDRPTLAILKHTNPCGVGQGETLAEAWEKAFATDRQAPFGGIIGVNRPLDGECAKLIADIFSEVIVAPAFTPEALAILERKKNLRLVEVRRRPTSSPQHWEIRSVGAESFLWQQSDRHTVRREEVRVVTKRQPTEQEWQAMLFGWRVVKHVKSNAIVYAQVDRTLGIGAGQMSRIDASRIAVRKADEAGLSLAGSAVCSDAFFPFPDGLLAAADAGATAAIQPGGSVRDNEVIAAANDRGMAMVFTGERHFRH
ncbi:MAG TPA: bifunctional phosphoribosylaminoimidazolecarboxamide formyltransferase/IMP cyclohydrolase [Verrucomicrobiota bacterium]|nr:bifunctional phosphoribosylaminoimidazolecarboxamide formyltransferase/IMP cyclohydrolase [Verrucomicrobiota bacterium]